MGTVSFEMVLSGQVFNWMDFRTFLAGGLENSQGGWS